MTTINVPCPKCGDLVACEVTLQVGRGVAATDGPGGIAVTPHVASIAEHKCSPVPAARGADIEIWEYNANPRVNEIGVIKPYRIAINGTEVLLPDLDGEQCKVTGLGDCHKAATVTLTMFARSIKVYATDKVTGSVVKYGLDTCIPAGEN